MIPQKNKYDLVIVGAGLSGFVAAAEASDHNINTLLIEKGRTLGGTGNYVEGMFAVESEYQKEHGIKISKRQIIDIEDNFSHRTADMMIWHKYVDESAFNIRWMEKHGVAFTDMRNLGTSGLSVWHIFKGRGFDAIKSLKSNLNTKRVEIVTSTCAKNIKLGKNGSITGLVVEDYSTKQKKLINTNNVILATGGFLNNPTLINELTDYSSDRVIPMNSGKNSGDGLLMAWNVGAYKAKGFIMSFGGTLLDPSVPAYRYRGTDINNAASKEGFLWINQEGIRFANEDVSSNWGVAGRALARPFKTFAILSQNQIDSLEITGGPITKKKYENLKKEICIALDQRKVFITKAESISELAQKLKTPKLEETVSKYNYYCKIKEDRELFKDTSLLSPIEKGPYYAFELKDGAFCAGGGLRINYRNQVLKSNGQPVKGLFAIGNDAANSITGDSYDVIVSGAEAGYCVYSGRNAVKEIISALQVAN